MDKPVRNLIRNATQAARRLLEEEFSEQLEGEYGILPSGEILAAEQLGGSRDAHDRLRREKLVAAIEHHRSQGMKAREAVDAYLREAAFTFLNRCVALKMLEARQLVQECITKGDQSSGFKEFGTLAPGLIGLADRGYRLYLECLFDELSTEIQVLFDRRDPASLLWPRRTALNELLGILNDPDLSEVWPEDETIGWVYQFFNGEEERRAMRDASQAPRNSRELAVRNQFFTPRYVVEFLTDNTLGRTWYEMRQGDTRLVDACDYLVRRPTELFLAKGEAPPAETETNVELSQEELFRRPVHIPYRAPKDPRELKILDPACGSGHFLLYCFDLLLEIHQEEWQNEGSGLRSDYPSESDLRMGLPGLILQHNLHGIDIDPRAAQIAALALWMRAQRAFSEFEIPRDQRPPIEQTNIVVAEPMPGDQNLLDEFLDDVDARLQPLVRKVIKEMALAGEAGSLLKAEEEIEEALGVAMHQAMVPRAEQVSLFQDERRAVQGVLMMVEEDEVAFWDGAEQQLLETLSDYASRAAGAAGVRRRLFAHDAAEGFAFIDLCRKQYDVVLTNPPFGAPGANSKSWLGKAYPRTKNDLYAAFVERGIDLLHPGALLGAITSRTGFFLSSFQKWREEILLKEAPPTVFADLGHGVLDSAMVEVAAYCLEKRR